MRTYEKTKNSGVHWIGEIPEHWEVKRLKYVAEIFPSNVDKKSKEDEEEILLCNYMDVYKNDYINSTIEFMNATASDSQIKTFKLNKGDVLATKDSETPDDIAVSAYVEEDFDNVICGYHLTHIKPNNKNLIGLFLFRLLQSKNYCQYFTTLARGVTRYALNTSSFSEMPTIVPPVKEQTAIANYLNTKTTEIDQTIVDKEALILLFEEEKKALINEAVTKGLNPNVKLKPSGIDWLGDIPEHWEVKRLKYLSEIKTGEKNTEDNEEEGQYPFFVRSQTIERISTYSFDGEAILTAGDGVGVAKVFHYINGKFDYHQRVYRISHFKGVIGKYIFHYLENNLYKEVLKINAKSTVDSLRLPMFQNFMIAVPTIKEQTAIVQYIETETTNINDKITLIKQEIELLKEYRQALIFEAVTGKIKVCD
jgi:type I restriction enzyme, S subunit